MCVKIYHQAYAKIFFELHMENSVKHQIHQILRITRNDCKTEYSGRTYAKNEVVLKPVWISDAFG